MFNKKSLYTFFCILLGSTLIAININTFVNAYNLFPGGFSGLTVLIQRICEEFFNFQISYSLVYYTLNIVPVYIGFKMIGKKFTIFSIMSIFLVGFLVDLIPTNPVTFDPLLIAVFGGIINGTGVGISLAGGGSSGGTDFIAMFLSKKFNRPTWNYVLGFNCCMLMVAGYLFGWDSALYSIIFQYVSTQVVNTLHRAYKKVTLTIMTTKPDEISEHLMVSTHHGVTRFEGIGCYSKEPITMLYTVISSKEYRKVLSDIREIDPRVFVNVVNNTEIDGNFYQAPIE